MTFAAMNADCVLKDKKIGPSINQSVIPQKYESIRSPTTPLSQPRKCIATPGTEDVGRPVIPKLLLDINLLEFINFFVNNKQNLVRKLITPHKVVSAHRNLMSRDDRVRKVLSPVRLFKPILNSSSRQASTAISPDPPRPRPILSSSDDQNLKSSNYKAQIKLKRRFIKKP